MINHQIDILIPTYNRPAALAVTLASLISQTHNDFRVLISDQSEPQLFGRPELRAVQNVLATHNNPVEVFKHLPRRGMAEQRHFLLEQVKAPYTLFLDDDLILEPYVIRNMAATLEKEGIGFVGCAVIGLSFIEDIRPQEQAVEFWEGPVLPEEVRPELPNWQRYRLHNAANLYHVQKNLGLKADHPCKYKIAWVGGCVMYDTTKLLSVGGFSFWKDLPPNHCGEDVLAQLRVMQVYGGCGLIPSGVYHQELPTTIPDRQTDAPKILSISPDVKMN
jgi:GT2 family glycosyltransferase